MKTAIDQYQRGVADGGAAFRAGKSAPKGPAAPSGGRSYGAGYRDGYFRARADAHRALAAAILSATDR